METSGENTEENGMVFILYDGDTYRFHVDYIHETIEAGLADLKRPTDITVHGFGPDGQSREIRLEEEIWQTYLIAGPWRFFADVWDTFNRGQAARAKMIADLKLSSPTFDKNCEAFISDLRHYGDSEKSRNRLDGAADQQYFIGQPYFNDEVRSKILKLPAMIDTQAQSGEGVQYSTLQEAFDKLIKKRSNTTICTAHDISPLVEAALGLSWDKSKNKVSAS